MDKLMKMSPVKATRQNALYAVLALFLLAVVYQNRDCLMDKAKQLVEGLSATEPEVKDATNAVPAAPKKAATKKTEAPQKPAKKQLSAKDLLPKSSDASASLWAKVNPVGETTLKDKNFLVGVDTQGSSLRNANLQLRADPPNPRSKVSPWMNSTIDEDQTRKTLC